MGRFIRLRERVDKFIQQTQDSWREKLKVRKDVKKEKESITRSYKAV